MKHTITMKEIKDMMNQGIDTFMKRDNSIRGCSCVMAETIQLGDEVVIDNYFTEVIE